MKAKVLLLQTTIKLGKFWMCLINYQSTEPFDEEYVQHPTSKTWTMGVSHMSWKRFKPMFFNTFSFFFTFSNKLFRPKSFVVPTKIILLQWTLKMTKWYSTFFKLAACLFTSLKSIVVNSNFGIDEHSELFWISIDTRNYKY